MSPDDGVTWQRAPLVLPRRRLRDGPEAGHSALVDRFEEEPHVNPNTQTREFSLRDPDGYYVTISELSAPRRRGTPGGGGLASACSRRRRENEHER